MAELDCESPSSVSQLSDHQSTDASTMSGSGKSEVNKAIHEDCQLDKNDTVHSSNVSNNFKSNNGISLNNKHDENKHNEQSDEEMKDNVCKQNADEFVEIQENMKNEQMSLQLQHSNGTTDMNNEESSDSKGECNENIGKNKKKRRIRFPDDSSITCSCEPPDPWKNAPAWTTDELMTAYKKSCEINGSKPVVKILQQLHGFSTPGKRKESFVLKGEKLDQKQVESIEEVLRRVQFTLVDLEATHLDDETAVALFDMIEHYESACQLNISFNRNISARGWQACSRLVRRTPTLNFLDIRNCDLNERTIPIFGRALKMGCHLTVLHMEGMSLTTRPLIILVAALKMNDTLQELFLAENKLVPSDGVQLGNLLRYNHRLNLLDLRNNNLQDVGVSHLCDGLVEQKSGHGLRTLVLWNNQISYQAMHALGRAIAASASLETLNIGHNGITNEGIHQVKDGLLKTTSLLRLGLQGTRISDEGAVALAEYIADSTILLRIDLRDNDIKTGGLMALSHAIRVNNSVTRIDLDKETKKESGMKDYADVQIRLLRDILTFQERNVQLVMEREEAERANLEKQAIEAEAAREREKMEKESGNQSSSPLENVVSNTESFTIIEPDSVEETQEVQSANDSEKNENKESLSEQKETESLPSQTFSEEEEHMPTHQRPSVLFARMGLQPQESLDSPRTPSADSSQVFQSPQKPSTTVPPHPSLPLPISEKNRLSASSCTPPEMLLSPQYYPKQLARKIFSVSRVSEEGGDGASSPPPDDLCEYDPLNVSLVSLISTTDPQPTLSTPATLSLTTPSSSQTSTETSSSSSSSDVVSPTTLVQDLANETVKQIESMTDESELPPVLAPPSNARLSESSESESEHNNTLVSQLDDSELLDNSNCDSKEEKELLKSNCSPEVLQSALDADDTFFVKDSVDDSDVNSITEKMKEAQVDEPSTTADVNDDNDNDNDDKVCDKVLQSRGDVCNQDAICAMENTVESSNYSELPEVSNFGNEHVTETKEVSGSDSKDILDSNVNDESSECLESGANNVQSEADDSNNLFTSPNVSTVCSSSSNSSALENPIPVEAATASSILNHHENTLNENNKTSLPEINPNPTVISGDDIISHLDEDSNKLPSHRADETSGVELDGVEFSLEEEQWTALDKDDSNMAATPLSSSRASGEEKQPDFFTTLSMNGLTQELASALTSLDGSTPDFDDGDLGPDEFEQELDAMIAEVQNKPSSTLSN